MPIITVHSNERTATVHGYEHHDNVELVEYNGVAVVVKVKGYSYTVGSRHSMLGRRRCPTETKVYRIERVLSSPEDVHGGTFDVEADFLIGYPARRRT